MRGSRGEGISRGVRGISMEGSSGEVRTNFILWGFLGTFPFNGNKKSDLQTSFNGEGEIIKYSLFFFF